MYQGADVENTVPDRGADKPDAEDDTEPRALHLCTVPACKIYDICLLFITSRNPDFWCWKAVNCRPSS